jgi:catechol 2,3-dioxygenase-like lactoylglutathione lyase family enzyme
MSNVHVHLHVSDLSASRAFYERFLGAPPVKVKPGYAKFLPAFAPINLALSAGESGRGKAVDHLGFQVESREVVRELAARVKAAGLSVREEIDTNCCYANQDKFWVRDPDGVEWEVYHLNYDLDEDVSVASTQTGCCVPVVKIGRRP